MASSPLVNLFESLCLEPKWLVMSVVVVVVVAVVVVGVDGPQALGPGILRINMYVVAVDVVAVVACAHQRLLTL